jgi:hypothetical protein
MKADDFATNESLVSAVVTERSKDKKLPGEAAAGQENLHIYGAGDVGPGHQIHHIRKLQPHVWEKIKNWD